MSGWEPPQKTFWIIQWNCRGIKGKINELKCRIESWGERAPDAILLQEARHPEMKIRGYTTYNVCTAITNQAKQKKEGLATILIKEEHPQSQIDTSWGCGEDQEVTGAKFTMGKKTIFIYSFYTRPNMGDESFRWVNNCTEDQTFIGGDFNAEHELWGNLTNKRGEQLKQQMRKNRFLCANQPGQATRMGNKYQSDSSPDSSWIKGLSEADWQILDDPWGSDHAPIAIMLHNKTMKKREVSVINWDKFRSLLTTKLNTIEQKTITDLIQEAADEATRRIIVKEGSPNPDNHLLNLQEGRHKALLRYRRKKNEERRKVLNQASREVEKYTRNLRKHIWEQHCGTFNNKTSVKKLWGTYRTMLGKKKGKNTASNLALKLNITEVELAQKLGETFFPQPQQQRKETIDVGESREGQDLPFTREELDYAIKKAKKGTAPGTDGITTAMLKNLPEEAKRALLRYFNEIWEDGKLPGSWKHSVVVPIPKPNKPKDKIENLRPISLTSNICKTMERMVLGRINWTLEHENRLHPMQTGFRKALCTQDSLALLHHDLTSKKPTVTPKILVAVDIRKAFDLVPHSSVLKGARSCGIQGKMLKFIEEFLRDRTYSVCVGEERGPTQRNHIGVPQGAILSPTLFNIVMSRLAWKLDNIKNLSFTIYADDVTLWTKGGVYDRQANAIKEGLKAIEEFTHEVSLQAAPDKTALILIATPGGRKKHEGKHIFCLAGTRLQPTESTKILGMHICQNGKANDWLKALTKNWNHTLSIIRRTATKSWGANEETLRMLIKAFLVSKATYGFNYTTLSSSQKESIKILMRKAQRVVTGLPKHARKEEVRKWAELNEIEDVAEESATTQKVRLHGTKAGRAILIKMRNICPQMEEPEEEPPPWESALIKTDVPDKRDQVRDRETAGMKHLRRVKKLQKKENTQVIYTDATVTKEGKAACAWFNTTKNNYGRRLLEEGTHVKRAELEAVADAIQSHCHEEKKTIYLFSDSREAIEELRNPCTMDKAAQKIMINIKEARSKDTNFYLEWVPGHSGILGQDRAEREAKAEIIFQYYRHQSTLPAIVPVEQRDPFDFAPHEARDVNKERRRARLNALKPIPPALPTMRLSRWQRVCIRRLHSEATNDPCTLSRKGISQDSGCPFCEQTTGSLRHMFWECECWKEKRMKHKTSARVISYEEWTQPLQALEDTERNKELLKSLLDFIASTGIKRFI